MGSGTVGELGDSCASCRNSRRTVWAALATGGVILAWLLYPAGSYRFRMTVEAQTPQGPRSASAVYEVSAAKNLLKILPEERAGYMALRGQAVVLDLPGGPVFVLMRTPSDSDGLGSLVTKTFRPDAVGGAEYFVPAVQSIGRHFWGTLKAELPPRQIEPYSQKLVSGWPVIVHFRDINDPKSVEAADPDAIGVKRIWVETTGDPVTTGIEKRLRWLTSRTSFSANFAKYNGFIPPNKITVGDQIAPRDFITEFDK